MPGVGAGGETKEKVGTWQALHGKPRDGKLSYRVEFTDADKRRRKIRLGGSTLKDAQHIASKVQALVNARVSGRPLDSDVAAWVAKLGDDLANKLAEHGLIERRAKATLGPFIDGYIASRTEAASNTVRNWKDTRRKLTDFLGEDRDLRAISAGDADDWRQGLVDSEDSEATISKAVKHAKQFLKVACRKRLADANPFAELKAGGEKDASRQAFVTPETIAQVLRACPDTEWRDIVALARYGGLRCPSELLALRWSDVDWERQRFTYRSKQNQALRVCPIFPSLLPYLEQAFEQAPEGSEWVVNRYRGDNKNLRTQMLRILRRAGVKPWPRLFHNLRASCQTDLENHFPYPCRLLLVGQQRSGGSQALPTDNGRALRASDYPESGRGGATGGARPNASA